MFPFYNNIYKLTWRPTVKQHRQTDKETDFKNNIDRWTRKPTLKQYRQLDKVTDFKTTDGQGDQL